MGPTEKAFTVLMQHYQPTYSVDESDEQLTTKEIFDRIMDVTGDVELTTAKVFNMMDKAGFVFDYVLGDFKWLLKTKVFAGPG